MILIEPARRGDALQEDIETAQSENGLALWWLGQSGFLLKSADKRILFDPYLSDSLTKKYANTDKPHIRMTRLAIDPQKLTSIDLVTSSHNHTDHLDSETLKPIFATNPNASFIIPEANRAFVAERLGCHRNWPMGISDGESITTKDIVIHAVPAAHNTIDRDDQGRCHYLGYIVKINGVTIYHSGDTLQYPGMAELLKPFAVDVALLPINGHRSERRVAGNLFGDEAARLALQIGARLVIPCHYDMFAFNTETPDLFVQTCEEIGQPFKVLNCGEQLHIDPR